MLGPLCHVVCARPLDPGERKLLRLRRTVVALCPAAEDALALIEEGNVVAFCDTGASGPLGLAAAVRRHVRGLGLRPRGLDRRLVEAATLGGARALGLDRGRGRIGALAPAPAPTSRSTTRAGGIRTPRCWPSRRAWARSSAARSPRRPDLPDLASRHRPDLPNRASRHRPDLPNRASRHRPGHPDRASTGLGLIT
ncbi:hypothetical protein ACFQ0B_28275 [Nonomuraea thailandensis]